MRPLGVRRKRVRGWHWYGARLRPTADGAGLEPGTAVLSPLPVSPYARMFAVPVPASDTVMAVLAR